MRGVGQGRPSRSILRVIGATAVAVLVVPLATVSASAAPAGTPQAGYWWLPEPVAGLIPVPGVPSDGLYVACAPTGAQAESAIRFPVAVTDEDVELTLHVSAFTRFSKPEVVAYPATTQWQTGGPQPWSARPGYRTSGQTAVGEFDPAGNTMTIEFPASLAATGIVLAPATFKQPLPTFTISFAPPTAADITVTHDVRPTSSPPTHRPPPSHRPSVSPAATDRPSSPSSPTRHPGPHPPATHSTMPTQSGPATSSARPPSASASPTAVATPQAGDSARNAAIIGIAVVALLAGAGLILRGRRR
mgnify:CR=1 FL=1